MEIDKLLINPSTPLQKVEDEITASHKIHLYIKRLDLTHPQISGNKWYKLKYNLINARKNNYNTLLTFGGAYSNHIYATAAAGKIFNFNTIGIIRGEKHSPLNPTLTSASKNGMTLHYIDRNSYRTKTNVEVIKSLYNKFGNFYLIPEGGSNKLAVKGCSEIINELDIPFNYICTACGTGGTLAGIISGLNDSQKALGFAVLKGAEFLFENVKDLLYDGNNSNNWDINLDYHFGGYAKIKKDLILFINDFEKKHNIPIEPIYSGKMLFGLYDLIKKDYFPEDSVIIVLHNGGLQGLEGMRNKIDLLD